MQAITGGKCLTKKEERLWEYLIFYKRNHRLQIALNFSPIPVTEKDTGLSGLVTRSGWQKIFGTIKKNIKKDTGGTTTETKNR